MMNRSVALCTLNKHRERLEDSQRILESFFCVGNMGDFMKAKLKNKVLNTR